MQEIGKKVYAISYGVFRITSKLTEPALREYLERGALDLLRSATAGDDAGVRSAADSIEYLLKLGADVGIIHPANAEVMVVHLRELKLEVGLEPVHLEDIFSVGRESVFSTKEPAFRQPIRQSDTAIKSETRQAAILDRIRQSGNCRIKDIQQILPDCSERTVRYDLQALVEQNLIERVGNGGPTVYYRIRQAVA